MRKIEESISYSDEKTNQITFALDVIRALASQTSILSYNAAIEAASAGEAGRSFAVVAHQIGKLANKAKESTKSVSGLIRDIKSASARNIMTAKEAAQFVASSSEVQKVLLGKLRETVQLASETSSSDERDFPRRKPAKKRHARSKRGHPENSRGHLQRRGPRRGGLRSSEQIGKQHGAAKAVVRHIGEWRFGGHGGLEFEQLRMSSLLFWN